MRGSEGTASQPEEGQYSLRVHQLYQDFLEVVQSNLEGVQRLAPYSSTTSMCGCTPQLYWCTAQSCCVSWKSRYSTAGSVLRGVSGATKLCAWECLRSAARSTEKLTLPYPRNPIPLVVARSVPFRRSHRIHFVDVMLNTGSLTAQGRRCQPITYCSVEHCTRICIPTL